MLLLTQTIIFPLLASLISLLSAKVRVLRFFSIFIIWLQIPWLIFKYQDLLSGNTISIPIFEGFILDKIALLFLILSNLVLAISMTHSLYFFAQEKVSAKSISDWQISLFYFFSCIFLLAMTFVFICDSLGYLWISIEATTLSSAFLVYHARNKHAIEATWKYLMVCSVGIAFALFGTVLIFASSQDCLTNIEALSINSLMLSASKLNYPLLRLGFIFCLLGYGTKAGVFPLHSWLPDAHSEAPAPASAMLSGALLNCALFAIFRLSQIVLATQHSALALEMPLTLGVITVLAASFFLLRQHGIKRLWAYSSIENVGLMLVAIGLNQPCLFFWQALNHSLAKVALFLLSGNLIQTYGTKKLSDLKGVLYVYPLWALLLCLAAFAVTGAPPFGAFVAEINILSISSSHHYWAVLASLIFALALSFVAVSFHVLRIVWGQVPEEFLTQKTNTRDSILSSICPGLLILATLIIGTTSFLNLLVRLP